MERTHPLSLRRRRLKGDVEWSSVGDWVNLTSCWESATPCEDQLHGHENGVIIYNLNWQVWRECIDSVVPHFFFWENLTLSSFLYCCDRIEVRQGMSEWMGNLGCSSVPGHCHEIDTFIFFTVSSHRVVCKQIGRPGSIFDFGEELRLRRLKLRNSTSWSRSS